MDQFFGDLDFVFVYLDDILISSGTKEEHCRHLYEVFGHLSKAGLAINLPKSKFSAYELEFLGHLITLTASGPLQSTWQQYEITLPHAISRFFFRSFLPNAALLLQPLTSLIKKSAVFVWEKSQQDAFQQAKQALLNAVTLQVQLNTDASGTHLGAALMQREKSSSPGFW